jgi:hypothetical protein
LQIGLSRGLGLLGPNPVGLSRGFGLLGPNPVGLFRRLGLLGPNPVGLFRGIGLLGPNPVGLLGGLGLLDPNPVGLWFGLGLLGPKPKLDSDSLALKSDSGLDSDSVCFLAGRRTSITKLEQQASASIVPDTIAKTSDCGASRGRHQSTFGRYRKDLYIFGQEICPAVTRHQPPPPVPRE